MAFIDGAFGNDFPHEYIDDKMNSIAVYLSADVIKKEEDNKQSDELSLLEYYSESLMVPIIKISKDKRKSANNIKNLKIIDLDISLSWVDFYVKSSNLLNYFSDGYQKTKKQITN